MITSQHSCKEKYSNTCIYKIEKHLFLFPNITCTHVYVMNCTSDKHTDTFL